MKTEIKTAEDFLKQQGYTDSPRFPFYHITMEMKAYARKVAQAVLREAADNVEIDNPGFDPTGKSVRVDCNSILLVDIEQFIK